MTQTAIALYPTTEEANNVQQALTTAGHDEAQIDVLHGTMGTNSPLLDNLTLSDHDAAVYREGMRRGGGVVLVTAPDDRMKDAVAIMEQHNTLNIEERSRAWRAEGWQPSSISGLIQGEGRDMPIGDNRGMIGNNEEMIGDDAEPQPGTITPDK